MENNVESLSNEPKIIKTDVGNSNGQDKCPKCGATDISLNVNSGKLRCNFCRCEFAPAYIEEMEQNISTLKGQILASGATDIVADTNDILTFKCSSCGAEVVIDTASSSQARCHWCRNTLSVNEQIPNGSIPDVVLPFNVTRDNAKKLIEDFAGKRKFYAHPKFKQEFTTANIMGVYFPYMVVDINAHASLTGNGEKTVRQYTRGSNDDARTYYDADLYNVTRTFDIAINGLTLESSLDKLTSNKDKTNNVINAIMPFDIENCVKYNANYLKGYTSEKRDTNITDLKPIVTRQAQDIARYACNETLKEYDRGVAWRQESFDLIGEQWKSAYLPVWLYSYQEVKGDKKVLHYVAVNARTKETMGSIPLHMPKLVGISILLEFVGLLTFMYVDFDYNYLFLLLGIVYFIIIYFKYRNSNARHTYETETKKEIRNLEKQDTFVTRQTGLQNSMIRGANNKSLSDSDIGNKVMESLVNKSSIGKILNGVVNNDKKE